MKQYGHSKNLSSGCVLGGGGKATASRAGCHVEGVYSDTVNVDWFSTSSSRARFKLVAVVTDTAGGADSTCGMNELSEIFLPKEDRKGISFPRVKPLCEEMEARA